MKMKVSLGVLILFVLLLGLVRSDVGSVVTGHQKRVELNFWNGFTGPDGRVMLGLIRKFNEANPDVNVSMQRMDWTTYYNKLLVGEIDNRGPEVFVLQSSWLPRMHRAGFVSNVDELYQGGISSDDFDPLVISQVRYGSDYVGVPLDIWPFGLYYNVDLLKKAGITDAKGNARPPTNKDEFLKAARQMQKDNDGDGKPDIWGYALTNWRWNFQTIAPQFDGHYFDKDGRADLLNPGNIEALRFLGSLTQGKPLAPPPENALGWVGYRQQKVAMVLDGIFMVGDLQRMNDFHYMGAPVPVIGKHPGTMAESHVLCVKEGLDEHTKEAAERFVRFLSDNSIGWAAAGQVPARKSVRAKPEFREMPVQYAFSQQIPYMAYIPRTNVIFELNTELDLAVEKVIRGRSTPEDALKVANDHMQAYLDNDKREREVAH